MATVTYEVKSEQDKVALARRIAQSTYRKPYLIRIALSDQRTSPQNALMWSLLADISRSVEWFGRRMTKEEWKDVFSAAIRQQ